MLRQLHLRDGAFFQTPRKAFRYVGIDPLATDASAIIKHPLVCYGLYIATFMFVLAAIDYCLNNTDDAVNFTETVSLLNQLIIALSKIAIFFKKRSKIHRLIKAIWQWHEEKANGNELEIISQIMWKNVLVSRVYYITVLTAGVFGLLKPLITTLIKLLLGLEGVLEVPHKASFFWNTSNFIGYIGAYLWNIITIHFLIFASLAIDTLFLWSVSHIVTRFSLLKIRFEKAAEKNNERKFSDLIKDAVKIHLQILHLSQELDAIFGEIIFIKSLISCTQICFLTFCFMQKNTSAVDLIHPFIFLLAVCMQLMLYCFSGTLIQDQSLMVSADVYETLNWCHLPVRNQKMLQMIMLRSQKSCHITGIFFNLNLSLFLWFFKTAASLMAVLKTLQV